MGSITVLFQANGDAGVWVRKNDDVVGDLSISGFVKYFSTGNSVGTTNLTLTNGISETRTSDENGFYEFAELENNVSYVVTPEKTGDISTNTILSFDASQAAQIAFDILPNTTDNQRKAADVDKDGNIYLYDASMIARHAVGLDPVPETYVSTWQFIPPNQTLPLLNSNEENVNFTAMVLGDVDGNWSPADTFEKAQTSQYVYFLTDMRKENGEEYIITFIPEYEKAIYSYDISLTYDQEILQYERVVIASSFNTFNNLINNSENGKVRIGGYGIEPVKNNGVLLEVVFRVIGENGESCEIELEKFFINNDYLRQGTATITVGSEQKKIPDKFVLDQNYPNPFNPVTDIQYHLPAATHVSLIIYNIQGQKIKTLYEGKQGPGVFNVKWNGEDDNEKKLTSGAYIYRLKTQNITATKKMLLLR